MSIGSLYQYFPNKDALLVSLAERHVDDVATRFGARLAGLREERPPLDTTVRALLDLTVEVNDTSRLHAILFSDCPRTPALVERLGRFTDVLVAEVAWHLERTGSAGRHPELRARLVVAAVDAAVHEVVLAHPPGPARAAATDELVAVTVGGLAPGRGRRPQVPSRPTFQ